MDPNATPLTDAEEHFMYFEVPPVSPDYARSRRPGGKREGFVSSNFARRLEREIRRLQSLTENNGNDTLDQP